MKLFKKFPNTAALLMCIIVLCAALTYIVPAGQFDRVKDDATGRTLVVAGSFKYVDQKPVKIGDVFSSLYYGLYRVADIVAFCFVIGGAMTIVIKSGAINAALTSLIIRLDGKTHFIIPIVMVAFSFAGATFGIAESTLAFITILLAMCISLGYDRIVAISCITVGAYAGYSTGPLNPFSVGIAQTISELPIFSGMGLRTVLCAGATLIAIHHTMRYAARVKANPQTSFVADIPFDMTGVSKIDTNGYQGLTRNDKIILLALGATLIALVYGVLRLGWYLGQISALFMALAFLTGMIIFEGDLNRFADEFTEGARGLAGAALLVGFSRAVLVVMENGLIMDTIIYACSLPLSKLHSMMAGCGMYFIQGVINFFIPSSTGQAVVVMPIFAPLSDLVGVSRQVAVTAFQCGDGLWNMITPTHAVLMASLGLAGIPFSRWFKFALPLVIKWSVWVCIVLCIGQVVWK